MNKLITKGVICQNDDYNFIYRICDIDYIEYENGEYEYLFYPHYNVIQLLDSYYFQGIPGINLEKKKECYIRKNMTPVFISERTPGENRVDLWELLDKYGMKSLNRLEWLIRTDMKYCGDNFYVERRDENNYNENINLESMFDLTKRSDNIIKALLEIICYGKNLNCKEISINNDNRLDYYKLLMPIYIKDYKLKRDRINKGITEAKLKNTYKGRKQIPLDTLVFREVANNYSNKNITLDEALDKLNISKSTFFRRLNENKDIE